MQKQSKQTKLSPFFIVLFTILLISCQKKEQQNNSSVKSKESVFFTQFTKVDSLNPILNPSVTLQFIDPITNSYVKWEERNVLNPTAVIKDGKVYLMYRAQDFRSARYITLHYYEE